MKRASSVSPRGPIAKRVIADLRKQSKRKVVDLGELRQAKMEGMNLLDSVVSRQDLSQYDPLHGVYVYAQNLLSVFVEQIAELPPLAKLADAYFRAEEEYMPSGPPMSPLTGSYFFCWGCFDLFVGVKKESFGKICIEVCRSLNVDPHLMAIFQAMQDSRMGLYVHEGFSNDRVMLREIVTNDRLAAVVPSGYQGKPGEMWFARVLPEPFPELELGYSVVFTTPYVIVEKVLGKVLPAPESHWIAYLDRTLARTGRVDRQSAYEQLMKYGLHRHYWNEYIFEAYGNHQHDMVLLTGYPDVPLSRPHSRESQAREDQA